MKPVLLVALTFGSVALAAVAAVWVGQRVAGAEAVHASAAGSGPRRDASPLLALTLRDASGRPQGLPSIRPSVLVLNFWAAWCAPCREEMPEFAKLQSRYRERGVHFIGIALDAPERGEAFLRQVAINYPVLYADTDIVDTLTRFGNKSLGLPFTLLIDGELTVAYSKLGRVEISELAAQIERSLASH